MATAHDLIDLARRQVGTMESPPGTNQTKYGKAYGMDGVPWCAEFIWWLCSQLKIPILKTAYTPSMAQWFTDHKRGFSADRDASRGDIVFFNFPDSLDRIQHVGIVVANAGNVLHTIEGNTSASASGSQDNGGGVFERTRGYSEAVYYGRLEFAPDLPRFDLPKHRTWFGKGDKGADVKTWQRDLNRWMKDLRESKKKLDFDFGKIDDDGVFGKETVKATITFQRHYDLDADGRVGKHTIEKMERVRRRQKS